MPETTTIRNLQNASETARRGKHRGEGVGRIWIVGLLLLLLPGCAWPGRFPRLGIGLPTKPRCVLDNPTQTELVEYLNESISRVPRWRCNEVTITSRGALGIPITLRAMIAVEERRNFRLVAHAGGGGTEVDLGSNDERFWFYARQSDRPGIYTCRHELIDEAQQGMPLPLNPEWFTEVLGVVPFENSEVTMQNHEKNKNWVYLIRDRKVPEGMKGMQLVTLVDCCQGLIIEQRLQETNGPVVAFARMRDFKKHPSSDSLIPHKVDLEWPQAKMGLTLNLKRIDISESPFATQMFDMPQIASVPVHDFSGNMARNQGPKRRSDVEEFREQRGRGREYVENGFDERDRSKEEFEEELPEQDLPRRRGSEENYVERSTPDEESTDDPGDEEPAFSRTRGVDLPDEEEFRDRNPFEE